MWQDYFPQKHTKQELKRTDEKWKRIEEQMNFKETK